jgi:acetyl-CoA carboxylase beta subunit
VAQEVVPVETGAADGWSVIQTSMRAVPVVLVDPSGQFAGADFGVVVGTSVGPFAEGRFG